MSDTAGISASMAVRMMQDAGMPRASINELLPTLPVFARYEGREFYNPTTVSRAIKKKGF